MVDNTNPDVASRKRYIDLAKKLKVPVRCVRVATPRPVAEHLNIMRAIARTSDHALVPDVAFHNFYEKLVEPATGEGFKEVLVWEFSVGPQVLAGTHILRALSTRYLVI